ncbi:hypothetical protein [Neobacillus thermocopriae]|uniref:hypothetical protein n=1 Tax=Neobacillus thermocopriae TaxID=1215031 RepID=UPI002E224697|nr:hypothetical protein [Neobacillus thermocopriae]
MYVTIIVIEYRSHVTDSIRHGGKIEGFSAFYDTAMPFLLALTGEWSSANALVAYCVSFSRMERTIKKGLDTLVS